MVIKDPFGQEQTIRYPYYFTDTLLGAGLHEYSYNAGFLRRRFGEESNRYGPLAFSAFHNYGLNDALTVGGRGKAAGKGRTWAPWRSSASDAGIVSLSLSGSVRRDGGRRAGEAGHTFQGDGLEHEDLPEGTEPRLRGRCGGRGRRSTDERRYEMAAGAGYGTGGWARSPWMRTSWRGIRGPTAGPSPRTTPGTWGGT